MVRFVGIVLASVHENAFDNEENQPCSRSDGYYRPMLQGSRFSHRGDWRSGSFPATW